MTMAAMFSGMMSVDVVVSACRAGAYGGNEDEKNQEFHTILR
jgi:hypothetical protein